MGINQYTFNNGRVDVEGDVDISSKGLKVIPVQFGYVGGGFYCSNNNLTSLEGGPREVGGGFYCGSNNFKSEPDHRFINIDGTFYWN